jgi:galactokinase
MKSPPTFQQLFGRSPQVIAEAPGRVNLIGEHTDYNGGYVLPMAIPQSTRAELAPRADRKVRAFSANVGDQAVLEYLLGEESPQQDWIDYVQGVTSVLATAGHGAVLGGFDLRLDSDVPLGGGLSSSASLEVSLLRALRAAFQLELDDVQLALVGHKTETDFVGAPIGVMDQMASSLADQGEALFIDTRSLIFEPLRLPAGMEVVVINSGLSHSHAAGDYRTRRAECEHAAELLGVMQLRDLSPDDLPQVSALPEPLCRRARHVVTENARVLAAVEVIRAGDAARLGALLYEGHRSLRDDFQVSLPEIDVMVELARATPEVLGARLTGGGFGGSVVILTRAGAAVRCGALIAEGYQRETARSPTVLRVT